MQGGRQRQVDKIDLVVCQHVVDFGIGPQAAEVHLGTGRTEVAANVAPVSGKSLGIGPAQRDHLCSAQFTVGEIVDHPHEADTGDADANHVAGARDGRGESSPAASPPLLLSSRKNKAKRIRTTVAIAAGASQIDRQSWRIDASGVA